MLFITLSEAKTELKEAMLIRYNWPVSKLQFKNKMKKVWGGNE